MISGAVIRDEIAARRIAIEPYDEKQLNPNSYNVRLHEELFIYESPVLDMAENNTGQLVKIPPTGLVLQPGELYLGRTVEHVSTQDYVPCIEGRSSVARLGIMIHLTAGFGDLGFSGHFTLEIVVAKPVRVYANAAVGQLIFTNCFQRAAGGETRYTGKYRNNHGSPPGPSQMHREFRKLPGGVVQVLR